MNLSTIKFTRGVPPVESFPNEELLPCFTKAMTDYGNEIQQYNAPLGFLPLRQQIAAEHHAPPEDVILGQGSLQLLDLAARVLIQPGDPVFVESPTYDRAITILRRAGAEVIGLNLAIDGPNPDDLEHLIKAGKHPRFAYLIPDFQNPSGTVMAEEKRKAITALAEKYNFLIFEDSPYRSLRYRGVELPTLHSLLPDKVCQMSSYSKTICPGLRVGFMVVPPDLIKSLAKMAEETYINSSYINQAIAFEYILSGNFSRNLEKLKRLYRPRLTTMLDCLEEHFAGRATWMRPDGGFFIGMQLNSTISVDTLLTAAQEAGLELTDGRDFFPNGNGENFIRLPFCGLTPEEIHEGIARLDQVISGLC